MKCQILCGVTISLINTRHLITSRLIDYTNARWYWVKYPCLYNAFPASHHTYWPVRGVAWHAWVGAWHVRVGPGRHAIAWATIAWAIIAWTIAWVHPTTTTIRRVVVSCNKTKADFPGYHGNHLHFQRLKIG